MKKEWIVIGGGPAGYVAAIRAAQLGKKVTLIEQEAAGGTCLNHGCIPTKALYQTAEMLYNCQKAKAFGVQLGEVCSDVAAMQARKTKIVSALTRGVRQLLRGNGVEWMQGQAHFVGPRTVMVGGEQYEAEKIFIATGSQTAALPIPGIDLPGVVDSSGALDLQEAPRQLVIIGGGVIGIEMAGIFRALGSEVTIVEFLPDILPMVDGEISTFIRKSLEKKGIRFLCSSRVTQIQPEGDTLSVSIVGEEGVIVSLACDTVLSCAGRSVYVEGLDLEKAGVIYDRKGIRVDENYETNVPGVYAIGDVTGRVMLAHVASEEGKTAVERQCGHTTTVDYSLVPNCVFTFPEVAAVGATEEQLKAQNITYKISRFSFAGNGKALTLGQGEGFVKVLTDLDATEILGVHIVGPHASDIIHEAIVAMNAQLQPGELCHMMHSHPSLPEALLEAVSGSIETSIHQMPSIKR